VKTYVFQIELNPDEDGWRVFYSPLEEVGASTWGETQGDALANIQEVLSMIMEELQERDEPIPATSQMTIADGNLVAVHV
jgi:predicted RNase H-like HicB family nuclease